MADLSSEIKEILPIDNKSKVDKLIVLLQQRNTVIDEQMCQRISDYIGSPQLEEYFYNSSIGRTLKTFMEIKKVNSQTMSSIVRSYMPFDSKAQIDSLIDAIKENGGIITTTDKTNIYLKIWNPSLKTYWANKCQSELKVTYLPPSSPKEKIPEKTRNKSKRNQPYSFAKKVDKMKRETGILDPNSNDYDNQVLKEKLKSKYTDYEYGLSDW